jgi:hypothetical protein
MNRQVDGIWRSPEGQGSGSAFHPEMVDDLPEPGRRYLLHAIAPGTPLATSVKLALSGSMRLARGADLLPMTSEELLAPPHGYVWKARIRRGWIRISGFDAYCEGKAEMRWWLGGLLPIVRANGVNLARSAEGRLAGEAIFLPSALLPSAGTRWEAVDDSTVRVWLPLELEEIVLTLDVGPDGSLRRVSFPRWNNDRRNGPFGYLRFVVDELDLPRTFGGYTIPTRFRAGWRLGRKGSCRSSLRRSRMRLLTTSRDERGLVLSDVRVRPAP